MANPNILTATTISGNVAYLAPANTTANSLVSNASSSGSVYKIESLTATNVTASAVLVTASINSAAAGAGTNYRIAYQISVPAGSSLRIIDKSSFLYLTENTSLVVTSGTSAALEYVASYEVIS